MDTVDTSDEIPLEEHRYFRARLHHLEAQHPVALLHHLETGTLTEHLRQVAGRAMQAKAKLVMNHKMPEDRADDLVMSQVVGDPKEQSRLDYPDSRMKLKGLLDRYKAALPDLPRTYQSQSETTE